MHYCRFPKELTYFQGRLNRWICLPISKSTLFNRLFRLPAALSLLRHHITL